MRKKSQRGMSQEQYLQFHLDFCKRARDLSARKNVDYADPEVREDPLAPFHNLMAVERLGVVSTEVGIQVRLTDKLCRLSNLLRPGHEQQVKDESIEDTMLDVVNYICLLAAYLEAKRSLEQGL